LVKLRRQERNHQTIGERRQRAELPNTLNLLEQEIQQIIDKIGDEAF
jgi:phosphoribosyl-ATP pyrophosphohydrolase